MGSIFYLDGFLGDDANDGLTRLTAKATIAGIRGITTANERDIVYCRPMVYIQPKTSFSSSRDNLTEYTTDRYYSGVAVFDFNKSTDVVAVQNSYFAFGSGVRTTFVNLHFRGMASTFSAMRMSTGGFLSAWHCVFYNLGTTTGRGWQDEPAATGTIKNCTFYNLTYGVLGWTTTSVRGCYFKDCTNNFNPEVTNRDFNAFVGNTETNGINTSGQDPGFVNAGAGNFRIDPTNLTYWQNLMTGGEDGGRIGSVGYGSLLYGADLDSHYPMSPNPSVAAGNQSLEWINEGPNGTGTYTEGTPGDIIYSGGVFQIDVLTTPAATGGRVVSPVYDHGMVGNPTMIHFSVAYTEFPASGAVIDTDTVYPRKYQYRGSNDPFDTFDVSPAWVDVGPEEFANAGYRYTQDRLTLQTGHTNT